MVIEFVKVFIGIGIGYDFNVVIVLLNFVNIILYEKFGDIICDRS